MTIYAFFIHGPESTGSVLYGQFYTGEGNDGAKITRQQTIVRKVNEDKSFQQQAASYFPTKLNVDAISDEVMDSLTMSKKVTDYCTNTETSSIPPPTEGIVNIAEVLFKTNKVAIWRLFENMTFTTVCDPGDNLTLISNNMILIFEHLTKKLGPKKLQQRITNEPDEVEAIVSQYIQNGSPLLANCSLFRAMAFAEEGSRPYLD